MGSHSSAPPSVPAELIADRKAGWHAFTRFTLVNCIGIAAILVLMLIFLRIL